MAQPKRWMANAFPKKPPPHLEVGDPAWQAIEGALGSSISASDRDILFNIGEQYLSARQFEIDPPLGSEAEECVKEVEKAAEQLHRALQNLLEGEGASYRVAQLFDYRLREITRGKGGRFGALSFISSLPGILLLAAHRVRGNLNSESSLCDSDGKPMREIEKTTTKFPPAENRSNLRDPPPDDARSWLIVQLASFARERGVPISAHGRSSEKAPPTQFVKFVSAVQACLPTDLRISKSSDGALSKAVLNALKGGEK